MHSGVRWSMPLISRSRMLLPVMPSDVLPPAFSTSSPNGAASKARRSLAGDLADVGLEKTPWRLVNCWQMSGTRPPVYRSVYLSRS